MILIKEGAVAISQLKDEHKDKVEAQNALLKEHFADLGCHLEALKREHGTVCALDMIVQAIDMAFEDELKDLHDKKENND